MTYKKLLFAAALTMILGQSAIAQDYNRSHRHERHNSSDSEAEEVDEGTEADVTENGGSGDYEQAVMDHSWELGTNSLLLLSRILPDWFQNTPFNDFDNLFTLRKHFDEHNTLYLGFNLNTNSTKTTLDGKANNSVKNNLFNISAGYERYNMISRKWNYYFGGNLSYYSSKVLTQYEQNVDPNGIKTVETKNSGFVIMPKFGVQFNLSSRINLSTELQLPINIGTNDYTSTFYNSVPTTTNTVKSTTTNLSIPYTLEVRVRL